MAKIVFKVCTTQFTVQSLEKQQAVLAYCAKIKKSTGRTSHKCTFYEHSSEPRFVQHYKGGSTRDYVTRYEKRNAYRFFGHAFTKKMTDSQLHQHSLFNYKELSINPQYTQDDVCIEEPIEG